MRVRILFLDRDGSGPNLTTTSLEIDWLISMLEKAKKGEFKEKSIPARSDGGNRYGEIEFVFFD